MSQILWFLDLTNGDLSKGGWNITFDFMDVLILHQFLNHICLMAQNWTLIICFVCYCIYNGYHFSCQNFQQEVQLDTLESDLTNLILDSEEQNSSANDNVVFQDSIDEQVTAKLESFEFIVKLKWIYLFWLDGNKVLKD